MDRSYCGWSLVNASDKLSSLSRMQASMSSTVRGTCVMHSMPSAVTITSSSIRTPPNPKNSRSRFSLRC
jgi:hypothetical protein